VHNHTQSHIAKPMHMANLGVSYAPCPLF
jgi:hypothetical protein